MTDPLLSHLLDIACDPAAETLILGGGFGIRMKQVYLRDVGQRTLIPQMPEARATQDIDFFLQVVLFVKKEKGKVVRPLLDRLSYEEHVAQFQFTKPFDAARPDIRVKVDLLARTPVPGEDVRVKSQRVGVGSGIDLHGRDTPEAFAVEESPLRIPISGTRSDGSQSSASILVPHPYASLNMKVKAAHDWLKMERGEKPRRPNADRHVFDVYMLVAMLTEMELDEGAALAKRFNTVPIAGEVRACAIELYGSNDAPGAVELNRQVREAINYPLFWQALAKLLGINL